MKYLSILISLIILGACSRGTVVVPEFEAIESDRIVLLEEMTGVSCPNCPKGTAEIDAIKELYGDQVIPIGIHGFFLSWPTKESEFDFRNDFAKELEMNLAPGTSKPAALFNRRTPSGESDRVVESPDLWSGYVAEQLSIAPKVGIEVELAYEETDRLLSIDVGILGLESIPSSTNISVMILENNIIDAQEDLNDIIEEFDHNHVLRTMLTPYDGERLASSIEKGGVLNRAYSFEVPEDEHLWKVDDLEVVVFVHLSENLGEVLQAALQKVER